MEEMNLTTNMVELNAVEMQDTNID
jgi:hypothetical protein